MSIGVLLCHVLVILETTAAVAATTKAIVLIPATTKIVAIISVVALIRVRVALANLAAALPFSARDTMH